MCVPEELNRAVLIDQYFAGFCGSDGFLDGDFDGGEVEILKQLDRSLKFQIGPT
ncbi:hypothetical protein RRSWK_02298 [Rhodopirellula sp. SWK7]|nr:hypothetical protein RRSWK_02298 [Rhodopirellula sp. SWK7]